MFNLGDQGQGAGEPPAGPAVPLLDAALYYAGLGWPVFPCEPRGKRPFGALAPHGVKDATCDALVIRAWWRQYPDANIGLACGHLFWVLDVDGEEGKATLAGLQSRHGALPPTVTSLTGSGGWHLFFGLPSGHTVRNSVRRLGLGLDTRGLGGYVIAPPSIHPSGQAYGFAEGFTPWSAPLAVAPAWLLDLLDPPTAPQAATTTRAAPGGGTDAYARVALEGELMRLAEAVEGERNHTLNRAAYALGQLVAAGRLVRKAVEAALGSVALASGLDPGEADRTIVSGLEAGMASPREISRA